MQDTLGSEGQAVALDAGSPRQMLKIFAVKPNETISKVSDDVSRRMTFNTAIAAIMELLNEVNRFEEADAQE